MNFCGKSLISTGICTRRTPKTEEIREFRLQCVSHDVLDKIYKLYVRRHQENLTSQNGLNLTSTLHDLLSEGHGEEQTHTRDLKNLAAESFTTGNGTGTYVIFLIAMQPRNIALMQLNTTVTIYYSVTIDEDQRCLHHLMMGLTNLLPLMSKIVSENGTNHTNLLETSQRFQNSNCNSCVLTGL